MSPVCAPRGAACATTTARCSSRWPTSSIAPACALQWHWVDIEDEAELVGDLDVETFPTIVVADDAQVRFAGPVEPQRETLQRLLRATVGTSSSRPAVTPEVDAFVRGLRRRQPDRMSAIAPRSSKSA